MYLAALALTAALAAEPATPPASPARQAASDTSLTLDEAATRYRSLRVVPGRFSGGKWEDTVDRWLGEKHRAMNRLADSLGQPGTPVAELRRLMAEPDRIVQRQQADYSELLTRLPKLTAADELWIYRWRGDHDFLVFAVERDQVKAVQWYLAGE
ncbi:hypothetical protein [Chitinimonas lacunae]|uniref:Uncharacterized protein n=1 Tax=Chitinimonas lacunae TaxID=1963018 RepID=A0ABV8MNH6_9NEIS